MNLGIIIIFHNNENQINTRFFIKYINEIKNITFCFVNNCSLDNTFELLNDIKNETEAKVSIVDIKKYVVESFAIKAGVRFMSSNYNLKHIGFLNSENFDFENLLKIIIQNNDLLIEPTNLALIKQTVKQKTYKNIFSVVDFLSTKKDSATLLKTF